MNKTYSRINWENYPSIQTPLNEQSLNKMDGSVDEIDNRVISLDTRKFDKSEAQNLIKSLTFNPDNGVFTITYYNGSTATIDTLLEKLAVNFDFDETTQRMVIYLSDGTEKYVDLSAFLTPLEFIDSDTIDFQLVETGKVTAIVKEGSIKEKHLQPNYLAEIKVEVAKAQLSESNAAQSKANAENSAKLAESYAHGGTGIRDEEDSDNAKKYKELAEQAYENIQNSIVTGIKGNAETAYRKGDVNITPEDIGIGVSTAQKPGTVKPDGTTTVVDPDGTIHVVGNEGTINYNELENRPSINNVTLEGNKTIQQLGGTVVKEVTQEQYDALPNTKQTDNIIYFIKDASGGGESNL